MSSSYLQAMAVDPSHEFVFAAGQDNRVRAWSLRTTEPLVAPTEANSEPDPRTNMLFAPFDGPVTGLQIHPSTSGNGMHVWVAAGQDIFEYFL
jgi:DDB1- and CUL4-associated factor 4